jgi:acyl-CoA hydrolase
MEEEQPRLRPKTVAESQVVMSRQMMPDDANPWGYVHGGTIMKMVDEAAGSAATRHTRMRVATAAIDYMSFLHPVHVGDLVTVKASVNDVGHTSMEVGVRVEAENMLTGEVTHTSSCYLVMVALDENGRPTEVPPIIAETPDQRRRMAAAKLRRERRRQLQQELQSTA